MPPDRCSACQSVLRLKASAAGICPYCGGNVATGENRFQAPVREDETPSYRRKQRLWNRLWGGLECAAGLVLVAMTYAQIEFTGKGSKGTFVVAIVGGILAAHGLLRVIFGSGPKLVEDDFDFGPKD